MYPTNYELEISSDCNAACPSCDRTDYKMPPRSNDNLTLDDIKNIFYKREMVEGKYFNFSGVLGDPILNPECLEICEFLDSMGGQVSLSTNGGYNTAEWWSELAKIKGVSVRFAVDGGPETNHIYRVNVKWENLLRNMTAFSKSGGTGGCIFIPFSHNEQDYDFVKNLAEDLGFFFRVRTNSRNILNNNSSFDRKRKENIKIAPAENVEFKHGDKEKIYEMRELLDNSDQHVDRLNELVKDISCRFINGDDLFIGSDMTLWPCCHLYAEKKRRPAVVDGHLPEGYNDLKKFTIDEILQSEFYQTLTNRWYASHPQFLKRCMRTCNKTGGTGKNKVTSIS